MTKLMQNVQKELKSLRNMAEKDLIKSNKVTASKIAEIISMIEENGELENSSVATKLDFLIFMQGKNIPSEDLLGRKKITFLPGELLFNQWFESKKKASAASQDSAKK